MADVVITGSSQLTEKDWQDEVKFVGKTKAGQPIMIKVYNAINLENINWDLKEKNEIVQAVTFEGCYLDEDLENGDKTEPWDIIYPGGVNSGKRDATQIMLGEGKFYINDVYVGLTRDGGAFVVERAYRNITADGDPGTVKDRVSKDEGKPKLSVNMLQILGNLDSIYPAIEASDRNNEE